MAHGIEWLNRPGTKGETWNPITGCTPISEGCQHCYARRMAKRLAGRCGYPEAPHEFDVTLHEDKVSDPLRWRKPRTVFVCSMSDLFHKDVPNYYLNTLFDLMTATPQHTYIVLTKRARRMAEFLQATRWLNRGKLEGKAQNVWLGVTAENQQRADERIPYLLATPGGVRFVSVEPMLSQMYLVPYLREWEGMPSTLGWVICGAETGPGARPMDLAWARDLRDQCKAAGVLYFFKRPSPGTETPPDLMVREWPVRD